MDSSASYLFANYCSICQKKLIFAILSVRKIAWWQSGSGGWGGGRVELKWMIADFLKAIYPVIKYSGCNHRFSWNHQIWNIIQGIILLTWNMTKDIANTFSEFSLHAMHFIYFGIIYVYIVIFSTTSISLKQTECLGRRLVLKTWPGLFYRPHDLLEPVTNKPLDLLFN